MKDLKSKLIGMMLVIPLLLLFTTSSVVKITTILVDIPVSRVEIEGDSFLTVDIAEENHNVQINTVVYPENATDKSITYVAEAVEGAEKAEVSVSSDGLVTPLSPGTIKITALSGDRSASVQIVFYSSKVTAVTQLTRNINIFESEEYELKNNHDYSLNPNGATYTIAWESSAPDIVAIDKYSGKITGILNGTATVNGIVKGLKINNDGVVSEKDYNLSYIVNVGLTETETGISFAGSSTSTKPTLSTTTFNFSYNLDKIESYGELKLNYDETIFDDVLLNYANGVGSIIATFNSDAENGKKYRIDICASDNSLITSVFVINSILTTASISLNKTDYKVSRTGQVFVFGISTDATDKNAYSVSFSSSDQNILEVITIKGECYAVPKNEGVATVTATLFKKNSHEAIDVAIAPVNITVYNPYTSLVFDENSKSLGLEKEFAFGAFEIVGENKSEVSYITSLKGCLASNSNTESIANEANYKLEWSSSDETIATVTNGIVTPHGKSGIVTITAKSVYNDIFDENITASVKINIRADGVNVKSYDELMLCSENAWPTVLQEDIMLAPKLADSAFAGYRDYLDNECTFLMKTTGDDSYYVNNGQNDASVRYCVEFTADVYGNGHSINAQYITRSLDLFGYSVFNGPLDIVRIKFDNSSTQNAAVKAQDNIVFLIKNDDINLRNVELKGCSDSVVNGDLNNLKNCGTVLEIVGDNASVEYCRINNGRTVVRIFGKPMDISENVSKNPSKYRITADIGNCILSYAREFILKIGSNQSLKNASTSGKVDTSFTPSARPDLYDDAAPYLTKQNGDVYNLTDARDDYFYNNYVMTDLTLRDSVFTGAGLFCIGFETKFGGLCLHGYDYSDSYKFGSELGWGNVAGTSYPAVIKMQGDVRFYDWKKVDNINSDTLIEGDSQMLNTLGLNLNFAGLINNYTGENADRLTVTFASSKYVNGAIAFYGGGKNYSYIDTTEVSSDFNALTPFSIPLSYLGSRVNLIYFSAGAEDFRFLLYDSQSKLSINKQKADMADNTAYTWISKK